MSVIGAQLISLGIRSNQLLNSLYDDIKLSSWWEAEKGQDMHWSQATKISLASFLLLTMFCSDGKGQWTFYTDRIDSPRVSDGHGKEEQGFYFNFANSPTVKGEKIERRHLNT